MSAMCIAAATHPCSICLTTFGPLVHARALSEVGRRTDQRGELCARLTMWASGVQPPPSLPCFKVNNNLSLALQIRLVDKRPIAHSLKTETQLR